MKITAAYVCPSCQEGFTSEKEPTLCPSCGYIFRYTAAKCDYHLYPALFKQFSDIVKFKCKEALKKEGEKKEGEPRIPANIIDAEVTAAETARLSDYVRSLDPIDIFKHINTLEYLVEHALLFKNTPLIEFIIQVGKNIGRMADALEKVRTTGIRYEVMPTRPTPDTESESNPG